MKNLLAIFAITFTLNCQAQFSERNFIGSNSIEANPALTGQTKFGSLNGNYSFVQSFYKRVDISYQTFLPAIKSGIGISVNNIAIGSFRSTKAGIALSHQVKLNDNFSLSCGLSAFYHDTYSYYSSANSFSLNSGLALFSDKFFTSVSVNNLLSNYSRINLTAVVGRTFKIKPLKSLFVIPTITYSREGSFNDLQVRVNFSYLDFKTLIGASQYEFQTGLGYVNDRFGLTYVFSKHTSSLSNASTGQHRISLQFKIPKAIERNSKIFDFKLF